MSNPHTEETATIIVPDAVADYENGYSDGYALSSTGRPSIAPIGKSPDYYEGFNAGYEEGKT